MTDKEFNEAFDKLFENQNYHLPIRWDGKDFYYTVSNLINDYQKDVGEKFYPELQEEIQEIGKNIFGIIGDVFCGKPVDAYAKLATAMEKLAEKPLTVKAKDINDFPLYRAVTVHDNKLYDRDRLFHVPFNMRSKMATQRYSIAGYPSLYLGTSIRLCCEEIHADIKSPFLLVSQYKLDQMKREKPEGVSKEKAGKDETKITVYDLAIKPQDFFATTRVETSRNDKNANIDRRVFDNESVNDFYTREFREIYVHWYPLIAACSYVRAIPEDPFSPEYIVPQILMQWIRPKESDVLTGVRYFSCSNISASDMGFNYVFPTNTSNIRGGKFDEVLIRNFSLTKPFHIHDYFDISICLEKMGSSEFEHLKLEENKDSSKPAEKAEPKKGVTKEPTNTDTYIIPYGTLVVDEFSVKNKERYKEIVIPDTVTTIGNSAFKNCKNLVIIKIPNSVTYIGNSAFGYCTKLENIIIPNSVTSIESFAFNNCLNLKNIILSKSLRNISWNSFCNTALKKIIIPNSVNSIDEYSFYTCSYLNDIFIPDSVTLIKYYAFAFCVNLKKVFIPASVKHIEPHVFNGSSSLTIYCEAREKPDGWDKYWNPDKRPVVWGVTREEYEGKNKD